MVSAPNCLCAARHVASVAILSLRCKQKEAGVSKPRMSEKELLELGFKNIGEWVIPFPLKPVKRYSQVGLQEVHFPINRELKAELDSSRHVVFAILAGDEVVYVFEPPPGWAFLFFCAFHCRSENSERIEYQLRNAIVNALQTSKVSMWYIQPVVELALPDGEVMKLPGSNPLAEYLIDKYRPSLNLLILAQYKQRLRADSMAFYFV